jgi:hypothetical protein
MKSGEPNDRKDLLRWKLKGDTGGAAEREGSGGLGASLLSREGRKKVLRGQAGGFA